MSSTNPPKITESIVEHAALDWLGELGYEVFSGLAIAPGEPATERADYKLEQAKLLCADWA